jgi:type VI secretion system Hcp family effector
MLLTVDGRKIKGDATEKHFEKQIAIEKMEWEFEAKQQDKEGDQSQVMTPIPRSIKLTKAFDRSTTNLCQLMNTRKPFDTAVIKMVKGFGGDRPRTLIDITLTGGKVWKVDLTASESDKSVAVKETVELSFEEIKIEYTPNAESGQGDGDVTTFGLNLPSQRN